MRTVGRLAAAGLALWALVAALALLLAGVAVTVAVVAVVLDDGFGNWPSFSPMPPPEPVAQFASAEDFKSFCLEETRGKWIELEQENARSYACRYQDGSFFHCENLPLACVAVGEGIASRGRHGTPLGGASP